MTLSDIRAGLTSALESTGVDRVYPRDVDKVEPPALVVGNPDLDYDDTFEGSVTYSFPVFLLLGRAGGVDVAVEQIDEFLDPEGDSSVHAAVKADGTLGGTCQTAFVRHAAWGQMDWAGIQFVGVTFDIDAVT